MSTVTQPTLEQQRAAHAWKKAQGRGNDYTNLAKGLPALVMNSGLMQVMAFLNAKSGAHHKQMEADLRDWLGRRFPVLKGDFGTFMERVMASEPAVFQQITAEAMAWLRWSRQMAAAANKED